MRQLFKQKEETKGCPLPSWLFTWVSCVLKHPQKSVTVGHKNMFLKNISLRFGFEGGWRGENAFLFGFSQLCREGCRDMQKSLQATFAHPAWGMLLTGVGGVGGCISNWAGTKIIPAPILKWYPASDAACLEPERLWRMEGPHKMKCQS